MALIRSVIYFTDAEDNIEPVALDGMTWIGVKKVITKAFEEYYKKRKLN